MIELSNWTEQIDCVNSAGSYCKKDGLEGGYYSSVELSILDLYRELSLLLANSFLLSHVIQFILTHSQVTISSTVNSFLLSHVIRFNSTHSQVSISSTVGHWIGRHENTPHNCNGMHKPNLGVKMEWVPPNYWHGTSSITTPFALAWFKFSNIDGSTSPI